MTNQELIAIANETIINSYAPYSKYRVCALIVTKDGQIFKGVNIENASYGSTMCAERVAIYNAYANGVKKDDITMLFVKNEAIDFPYPCGNCLQVLSELFPQDGTITLCNKNEETVSLKFNELLPHPFKL